jgi:hypothetical protein
VGNETTGVDEPLGMPKGSVRSLLSLAVVVGAFAIAAYLLVAYTSSDLTLRLALSRGSGQAPVVVGGWIAAVGNVIGFYFGVRSGR